MSRLTYAIHAQSSCRSRSVKIYTKIFHLLMRRLPRRCSLCKSVTMRPRLNLHTHSFFIANRAVSHKEALVSVS